MNEFPVDSRAEILWISVCKVQTGSVFHKKVRGGHLLFYPGTFGPQKLAPFRRPRAWVQRLEWNKIREADLTEQDAGEFCENCGRPMVLKRGRFGTFFACSGYPECKTTKRIGQAEKVPDRPIDETCPQCGSPYLLEKWLKSGHIAACPNPECKYKHDLAPAEAVAS